MNEHLFDPRQNPLPRLFAVAAILTLLTFAWLSIDAIRDYRFIEKQLPNMIRIEELEGRILLLDEVLRTSVRMAAATGHPRWEARYREFEPQLQQAIKELNRLAPDAARGPAAVRMMSIDAELVALDEYAFLLVRGGDQLAAHEYVESEQYQAMQSVHINGVREFERWSGQTSDALQSEIRAHALWGAAAGALLILLLVGGWSMVLRILHRWRMALARNNQALSQKTTELEALNKQLDSQVGARTQELNNSMLATLNMMEDAVLQREKAERALAELEETQGELLEASRQRGMAEVATNVLHNVGNVLNSVNVSASLVVESIKSSRADSMAKVVAMLREREADLGSFLSSDPKGRHIPEFLEQIAQDWLVQQQTVIRELASLRANIDHIKEIVVVQQSHAKVSGTAETVNIGDLVEDSLRMNADGLMKDQVQVVREFEKVPPVSVEKHKVLQILVNLVRNAKHACDDLAGVKKKRMTLRIAQVDGRIRISVHDNGVGIAPENLTRIFAHGFTTRKDGHGFGLHSGALAATELGGSLSAHSDGPGKGSTFTLELAPQSPAART